MGVVNQMKETELRASHCRTGPPTNYIKNKIDGQDIIPMCRMCGERAETTCIYIPILRLEITEHKTSVTTGGNTRLRKLSTRTLARNILNLPCEVMWYDHSLQAVMVNDQVKLLWDFKIYSDYHLLHNLRPGSIFVSIVNLSRGKG